MEKSYNVLLTTKHYDLGSHGEETLLSGSKSWRIEGLPPEPHITVDAAIHYVRQLRSKATSAGIQENANVTIDALERLRRRRTDRIDAVVFLRRKTLRRGGICDSTRRTIPAQTGRVPMVERRRPWTRRNRIASEKWKELHAAGEQEARVIFGASILSVPFAALPLREPLNVPPRNASYADVTASERTPAKSWRFGRL